MAALPELQADSTPAVTTHPGIASAGRDPTSHRAWKQGEGLPDHRRIDQAGINALVETMRTSGTLAHRHPDGLFRLFESMARSIEGREIAPAGGSADPARHLEYMSVRSFRRDPTAFAVYKHIEEACRNVDAVAAGLMAILQDSGRGILAQRSADLAAGFSGLAQAARMMDFVADTEDAGVRTMQAGHPLLPERTRRQMAARIDLGAGLVSRIAAMRYVPVSRSLQRQAVDMAFASFALAGDNNPLLQLSRHPDFGPEDAEALRGSLLAAVELVERATRLTVDSALAQMSPVDPEGLAHMAAGLMGKGSSAESVMTLPPSIAGWQQDVLP